MNTIGKNIKNALENMNKSQKWLANELGVTDATVSAWITGVNIPRTPKVHDIAAVLNISAFELLSTPMDNPEEFYQKAQQSINDTSEKEYKEWLDEQPIIDTRGKAIDYLTERINHLKDTEELEYPKDTSFSSTYDVRFVYEFKDLKGINLDDIPLSNIKNVAEQWQTSEKALAERVLFEIREIALQKNREKIKESFLKEKGKLKMTLIPPFFTLDNIVQARKFLLAHPTAAYDGKPIDSLSNEDVISRANLIRSSIENEDDKPIELDKFKERHRED